MLIIIFAATLISVIFAPLGCLSLWKRYTYFADGFAHASILVGSFCVMICGISHIYAGIVFAIIFALAIFKYMNSFDGNVAIGLVSNFMLSVALIMSYVSPEAMDIDTLLFGDIISASLDDILILCSIMISVITFFIVFYKETILIVVNRDIAQSMGIKVKRIELLFLVLMSIAVFAALKIVGALLVTGMLLIPAVTARLFTNTPKQMIIASIAISLILTLCGLLISFYLDIPTAPIIICTGAVIYFILRTYEQAKS